MPLPPKVFDTLLLLVENQGHLIEKEEFLTRLWPDSFVEEVTLAHSISTLRKALRSGTTSFECIETVAKRGYRFIARVEVSSLSVGQGPSPHVILGVLPFEDLSADSNREYLADGLTEEVIAALGQVDPDHLSVIGRTSVMAYKRTTKPASEIGRELGAEFLIESSMRTEGGRFRITSKLVRVIDQVQIWAASYDAEPSSILSFQRELSTAIAEQIRLRLSPKRLDAMTRRQTHNPEAYDVYLRGRYFWNHFTPATSRRAIECYVRATELDSEYALAWSGLTDAYSTAPIHADVRPSEVWQKARVAAQNAISADAELAETETSLGILKFWLDWDWSAAEAAYRKAIQLDPSYSLAHRMLGIALGHMGQREAEARQAVDRARSLDPLLAMHHALSAQVAFVTRDYPAAIQYARQATVIHADFWIGHYQLAQAYEQQGAYDLALNALDKAGSFGGGNSKVLALRGYVLAKLGRKTEALAVLETLESLAKDRYIPPYAAALVHAGLDQPDAVFHWLDRALECHDVHLVLLPADPKWDVCRADSRFLDLLKRCGLPHSNSLTH
ncbi:MAG: winged helix-turn-helix domain-containing protein [Acidobacteriia bacterium]|nr:winged helix-turn-helix domain-containing protein [Terriglobia bacterium]